MVMVLALLGAWKLVDLGVAGVEWLRDRRPRKLELPGTRIVLEGWRRR